MLSFFSITKRGIYIYITAYYAAYFVQGRRKNHDIMLTVFCKREENMFIIRFLVCREKKKRMNVGGKYIHYSALV